MALIQCEECDRTVSNRASACPGCGNPIATMTPPAGHEAASTARPTDRPRGSSARFYSAGHVRGAAFFGSVLAGTHLVAANWRRLGRPTEAGKTWGIGILAFLAVVGLAFMLPDNLGATATMLPPLCGVVVADRLARGQQDLISKRLAAGTRLASGWSAFAIALCYAAPLCAPVIYFATR